MQIITLFTDSTCLARLSIIEDNATKIVEIWREWLKEISVSDKRRSLMSQMEIVRRSKMGNQVCSLLVKSNRHKLNGN